MALCESSLCIHNKISGNDTYKSIQIEPKRNKYNNIQHNNIAKQN